MTNKNFEQRIAFLAPHLREFALQDKDTRLDIIEHELDAYEIETLVWMNYDLEKNQKKKKITMMISEWTLSWIKIKAAEMWIPYQTCIQMVLHKYITGSLRE